MHWLFLIFLSIIFWGATDILYSKISKVLPVYFSFLVITVTQVILFAIAYFIFEKELPKNHMGAVWLLVLAALVLSAGNIAFYLAFKQNAPVSVAVPISTVGIALLGIIWGVFVAKEPLTAKLILGFILSSLGIFLMSYK